MPYEPFNALPQVVLPRGVVYVPIGDVAPLAAEALFPPPPAGFAEALDRQRKRADVSERVQRDLDRIVGSGELALYSDDGTRIDGKPVKGQKPHVAAGHLRDFLHQYQLSVRAASNIDWHYWLTLNIVQGWQAAALSLDICPKSFNDRRTNYGIGPGSWSPAFGSSSAQQKAIAELRNREELVDAALDEGTLNYAGDDGHGIFGRVRLTDFVAWFVPLMRLPLTPQLMRLFRPTESQTVANSWQADIPAEEQKRCSKYPWQWPIRKEAKRRMEKASYAKREALAQDLVPYAKNIGYDLDEGTIVRHCLVGLFGRANKKKKKA